MRRTQLIAAISFILLTSRSASAATTDDTAATYSSTFLSDEANNSFLLKLLSNFPTCSSLAVNPKEFADAALSAADRCGVVTASAATTPLTDLAFSVGPFQLGHVDKGSISGAPARCVSDGPSAFVAQLFQSPTNNNNSNAAVDCLQPLLNSIYANMKQAQQTQDQKMLTCAIIVTGTCFLLLCLLAAKACLIKTTTVRANPI